MTDDKFEKLKWKVVNLKNEFWNLVKVIIISGLHNLDYLGKDNNVWLKYISP